MNLKKREKSKIFEEVLHHTKNHFGAIQTFLNCFFHKKSIFPFFLSILSVTLVILLIFVIFGEKHSTPSIISTPTLEKIVKISDLSTFEAVYNGIAAVPNSKTEDTISYYVSYDGRVKAGINVDDITVDIDEKEKIITVNLPKVKITDVSVDIASLDYLFLDDKANTYHVSEEAYRECINDVTNKTSQTSVLYDLAEENAKNFIHALLSPFVTFFDNQYKIQIHGQGEA